MTVQRTVSIIMTRSARISEKSWAVNIFCSINQEDTWHPAAVSAADDSSSLQPNWPKESDAFIEVHGTLY